MGELESSLTDAVNADLAPKADSPVEPPAESPEQQASSGELPAKDATPQEILDWRKDQRYGRMWNKGNKVQFSEDQHKVINDGFYKSYRNIEKMYEPTKKELETLKTDKEAMSKLATEYGISLDKLKEVLDEHKSFKDPNNPVVSRGKYLSAWFDEPELSKVYKDKVTSFFQDLESQEMERRYPGMNAEQRQKMIDYENRIQAIETKEREESKTKAVQENSALIDKSINRAKEYAKSKGFEITKEMEMKVLDHCHKNGVNPKDIYYAFRELYDNEIDKVHVEKIKSGQLKNLDKNKGSVVLPPGRQGGSGGGSGSLLDKLNSVADV